MAKNRKIIALFMGVLVPVIVVIWFNSRVMTLRTPCVGDKIKPFELPALGGGYATFSCSAEKTLLIFLSSECPSCIAELSCLENLEAVTSSKRVRIIVVFEGDLSDMAALFEQYPVYGQIAYDGKVLCRNLGIYSTPTFLFIGNNGILHKIKYGFQSGDTILSLISSF